MSDVVQSEELQDPLNGLSFQQEQFVLSFMANGGKARLAAEDAGYKSPEIQGYRVLGLPRVSKAIEALRAERRREIDMQLAEKHLTPARLIAELSLAAGFDLGDLLTDGKFDPRKLQGEATKAIASYETGKSGTKVKLHDKLKAIDMLMDHYGLKRTPPVQANVQINVDFGERMAMRRARALGGRDGPQE